MVSIVLEHSSPSGLLKRAAVSHQQVEMHTLSYPPACASSAWTNRNAVSLRMSAKEPSCLHFLSQVALIAIRLEFQTWYSPSATPAELSWAEMRAPHAPEPNGFLCTLHSSCHRQQYDSLHRVRKTVMVPLDSTSKWECGAIQPTWCPGHKAALSQIHLLCQQLLTKQYRRDGHSSKMMDYNQKT